MSAISQLQYHRPHLSTLSSRSKGPRPLPEKGEGSDDDAGFTMIEILITTFIIGTVVTGIFGLFILSMRGSQTAERRIAGIALANERMEMVRNLPYIDVGTAGGIPAGSILQSEVITRNNTPYTVVTDIRYVDDPYDGLVTDGVEGKSTICHSPPGNPGGQNTLLVSDNALQQHLNHGDTEGPCPGDEDPSGADMINTDYKQVRVSVDWPSQYTISPVLLITHVTPQGIEGGDATGTLDFTALNAAGDPISGATVRLINASASPTIDITTQTNNFGRVILPGLPVGSAVYELSVTNYNFTTEETHDQTATFFPAPDYSHLSMIARDITIKTFLIDTQAQLTVNTVAMASPSPTPTAAPNIAYRLVGTKELGTTDTGDVVYKVDEQTQTNASGTFVHDSLDWDSYTMTIDGVVTGYDIKETSLVMPFVINPGDTSVVDAHLVPHTPISLRVTVVTPDNMPVDNASVRVTGNGYDQTLGTGVWGQVFFPDLPADGDYVVDIAGAGGESAASSAKVEGTSATTVKLDS